MIGGRQAGVNNESEKLNAKSHKFRLEVKNFHPRPCPLPLKGLCPTMACCPKIGQPARQLSNNKSSGNNDGGGNKDDEPDPQGGRANILALILLSIAAISAILLILTSLALYQTYPILVMATTLPVIITRIVITVLTFKKLPTHDDSRDKQNRRNNCHCLYAIRATIKKLKKGIMDANVSSRCAKVHKSKQCRNKKSQQYKGDKNQNLTKYSLRHNTPQGGE
jgi:hypothetical protein